jgi:hypothetical protein
MKLGKDDAMSTRQELNHPAGVHPDGSHSEGTLARAIEEQTAKLPSDVFLWAAAGSIGCSLAFKMMGEDHKSLFVGQWAPTFLILGLYNKLVKVAGSDQTHS